MLRVTLIAVIGLITTFVCQLCHHQSVALRFPSPLTWRSSLASRRDSTPVDSPRTRLKPQHDERRSIPAPSLSSMNMVSASRSTSRTRQPQLSDECSSKGMNVVEVIIVLILFPNILPLYFFHM